MERRIRVRTEDNFVMDLTERLGQGIPVAVAPGVTYHLQFDRLPTLRVRKLHERAVIPTRGSASAIGYDLSSLHKLMLPVGGILKVPTGLAIAVPSGHYGRIAPRSGLAVKHGVDVLAGVIDEDYRGEIVVVLVNHGREALWVEEGMRVAQLILERASILPVEEVEALDNTQRGAGGFGSSGQ